jgi:hypothetical protein
VPLVRDTSSGFTKVSTVVRLTGGGHEGEGEDITWDQIDQIEQLRHAGDLSWLRGRRTLDEFSTLLGLADLFPVEPVRESSRDYRRWAFESAALDLALRQAGTSFADAAGRRYRPVRFVASTRADVAAYLALNPDLEFKLDAEEEWDDALVAELAATDRVRVVDFKAYYRGTSVDLAPDAVLEDAALDGECGEALRGARDRLSFDAPIHSWDDVESLPVEPRWLNIKPSRFGTLRRLCECIDECEERGIAMYGGGQFELGPGRLQIQKLASVFYAEGPNDVAPSEYNDGPARPGLATSPLPAPEGPGF